jgi:uncharacterized protein YkwD
MGVAMAIGAQHLRQCFLLAVLGVVALLIAAGPGAGTAAANGPCNKWGDKESNEITVGHARKAVLCLLNRERHSAHLPKLDRDKRLQRAAQRHNNYMQNHHCFSHECAGEATLEGRLHSVGYLVSGLSSWSYGENIGWGGGGLGTPESMVRAWMNSSEHRANILSRTFRDIGIGYSKGTISSGHTNGGVFTTDFGLRQG